ncbi:DUF748 domain-containing protein [Shewanella waksmanii]|uniref:DUF748 domain-containing protein n=1 Tax=Shewanella waksmanii TaxID=213783 RepID=UPI003735130E
MSSSRFSPAQFIRFYQSLPKYQRYVGILLCFYLLFLIAINQLTPYLIKKYAPPALSEQLGRPVQLDNITINPFTFDTVISGFSISEQSGAEFVGFKTLSFDMRFWHSVGQFAFSLNQVHLQHPYGLFESYHDEASGIKFNFSDIIDKLTAPNAVAANKPATDPSADGALPHVLVNNITIEHGRLHYQNLNLGTGLNYPDLNVVINALDTRAQLTQSATGNQFNITIQGENGGRVSSQGQVQLKPLSLNAQIAITDVKLKQFWSFIDNQLPAQLDSGALSLKANLDVHEQSSQTQPLSVRVTGGQLTVDNLAWSDGTGKNASRKLVALKQLQLVGINIDANDQHIDIEQINSHGLDVTATLSSHGIDLVNDFSITSAATQPSKLTQATALSQSTTGQAQTAIKQVNSDKGGLFAIPELPWSINVSKLDLTKYDVKFTDNKFASNKAWNINNLSFSTGPFNAKLDTPIDYQLRFNINQQGHVSSTGTLNVLSPNYVAAWSIHDFDLAMLQAYLEQKVNLSLKQGSLSVDSQVTSDFADNAIVELKTNIENLKVLDNRQDQPLLEWKNMQVQKAVFNQQHNSLAITAIDFEQPFARIVIDSDKQTNFSDIVLAQSSQATSAINSPETTKSALNNTTVSDAREKDNGDTRASAIDIRIDEINLNQGATFFADNSLTPKFAASIEALNGQIANLNSKPDHIATVDITGKIDKYAPVTVKGKLNPLLSSPYLDLDLSFKHVELTSVNPYSGTYAGYYIDKGQLSLDLSYQLQNNQLVGSNHMVVDQLKLGEPTDSSLATSLPVTLAIALLQDRHGVIDLGVDVTGDVNDPDFGIGSIVLTAFTNVITKAVTAPFSLLGDLFGEDDQLDKVEFTAGTSTVTTQEQAKLNTLAKALADRPMLIVNIEGAINKADDIKALQQLQLNEQLHSIANPQLAPAMTNELSPSNMPTSGELSDALKQLVLAQTGQSDEQVLEQLKLNNAQSDITEQQVLQRWHMAMYNLTLNSYDISDSQLAQLASDRAKAVKAYLVEKQDVSAARIFLLDSQVDTLHGESIAQLTLDAQ